MSDTAEQSVGMTGSPPGRPAGGPGPALRALQLFGRQREATVFVVAVALFLYFAIDQGSDFTSKANLVTLFSENAAPIIIIALGEVMLLICGEIDLSVGFVLGFAPYFMHYLTDFYGVPGLLAIFLALLLGVVVGWVNAFFTVTVGVPSFITTLGTGFILLGLIDTTSHDEPAAIPADVVGIGKWLETYSWAWFTWAVVLTFLFHILLTRTRWGLHTVSVGGNQARGAGSRHRREPDQVRQLHAHRVARLARRPADHVLHETTSTPRRGSHADVLRGHRGGDRRHRDAGRLGDHHRRLLRRDIAGHPGRRFPAHRGERRHAEHRLRRRDPRRHGPERTAHQAAGKGTELNDLGHTGRSGRIREPGEEILRVEHISKNYGVVTALSDVNLRLGRAEVLGLIGDNGAGKSTLLKILCGFQPPTAGRSSSTASQSC